MIDPTKTLDTIMLAIDDVRRATPKTPAARAQMADALSHLYAAHDAVEASLRADGRAVTYPIKRADGSTVRVTVPEDK